MSTFYGNLFSFDTIYADTTALSAVDMTTQYNGVRAAVTDTGIFQYNKQATSGDYVALGGGYWDLITDPYLLMNASNQIDGSQISGVSDIALSNGTAAAPSLSFTSDTDTGLYRVGANDLGITVGGTLRVDISSTLVTSTLPIVYPVGSAAAPSLYFTGDTNSGLYWIGADTLGFTTNGVLAMSISAAAVINALPLSGAVGAAATPGYTFTGDLNTGLYWIGADNVGVSTGGTLRFDVSTTAVTSTLPVLHPSGSAAAPSIRVTTEASGLYLVGAGSLGVAIAGAIAANVTATALNLATGVALQIATVQVVGARATGWTTFAGTGTTNQGAINVDTFTATDANIRLLGQGVKGMLDALILHGLLGA